MLNLRRFWRHEGGSSFESLALMLSVIAVISVGAADFLHYAAKKDGVLARLVIGVQTQVAQLSGQDPVLRGGIDYTPTGTIVGLRRAPQLNPCTGAIK
ncbi:MAG TPA: hypothetical protein VIJ06_05120 [Methylovirgula sp.]